MQEEDIILMIGIGLSIFIHERSRIKLSSNNDIYRTCKSEMQSNN